LLLQAAEKQITLNYTGPEWFSPALNSMFMDVDINKFSQVIRNILRYDGKGGLYTHNQRLTTILNFLTQQRSQILSSRRRCGCVLLRRKRRGGRMAAQWQRLRVGQALWDWPRECELISGLFANFFV
jgi:hypothetical protein